jgi:hypothetical protein
MRHISVAQLADWLHPLAHIHKAIALVKAYFDETGTHDGSAITAIGGYVGSQESWASLETEWLAILEPYRNKGVRYFHMAEALAQEGQFGRIDKPNVNYIVTQLAKLLGKTKPEPFFSAVANKDWDEVVTDEAFLQRFPKPLYLCFENLVHSLWSWSRRHAGGELVVPVFAYHKDYSPRMAEIGAVYGAQAWYQKVLGPIAFDYPERVIPLQGADLLAHQMSWDVEKLIYEASTAETNALRWARGGRHVHGNWFDRNGLLVTMKRFSETGKI